MVQFFVLHSLPGTEKERPELCKIKIPKWNFWFHVKRKRIIYLSTNAWEWTCPNLNLIATLLLEYGLNLNNQNSSTRIFFFYWNCPLQKQRRGKQIDIDFHLLTITIFYGHEQKSNCVLSRWFHEILTLSLWITLDESAKRIQPLRGPLEQSSVSTTLIRWGLDKSLLDSS